MTDKIGLVTVTFNGEGIIDGFLDSVAAQDYSNYILYVVDNNSVDKTVEKIKARAKEVNLSLIANDYNNGVAGGNNQGIEKAIADGCEYIILINNDTEFEPALITKLLDKTKQTPYQIIVPKMMYYTDKEVLWFAGGFFNKRMGYMNYHVGMGEKDEGQYSDREITYAPTCCALVHKSVFDAVGLMDEKYFVYFDDTDFWFRVLKDGRYKILYINDVEFYHKVGSLTKSKIGSRSKFKFSDFVIRLNTRNRVYYLKKQRSILGFSNIIWFWIRINLRFLFSGKYNITFQKWRLIQKSFFEGLTM
jgi:GT2 family glycosyltransferase